MATISIAELFKSGAHFGHVTPKWHPKMKRYIFGSQSRIHLIDLRQTLIKLKEAHDFAHKIGASGGKVLFVGTKPNAVDVMAEVAKETRGFYVNKRWLGGTLTNFSTVRKSIQNFDKIQNLADSNYEGIIKKEANRMEKQRVKMEEILGGIRTMRKMPACIFIVDTHREDIAVKEAQTIGIPIVSICDTNCNPESVSYPIPANDDSLDSISLITKVFAGGLLKGMQEFEKNGRKVTVEEMSGGETIKANASPAEAV